MSDLALDLKSLDGLGVHRDVSLEGKFHGTIEEDEERFDGLGGIILRIQPLVGAKMMVDDTVLEAHHREGVPDKVWKEAMPPQRRSE